MFGRFVILTLLSFAAYAQPSQPLPPIASELDDGRFEFVPSIPEHVFIRGRTERVQMGIWQIDPDNRWTPGDQTRISGWTSNRPTRLINVSTNDPVVMFGYDPSTAELTYAGAWSGDVTVRIETLDGAVQSAPFRIRVLTPTVVYGNNAAAINASAGWGANVCETPMDFATCRSRFRGGTTDAAPLVLFFTPGRYTSPSWYIGTRRFEYVVGDPKDRPWLVGSQLSSSRFERWVLANLQLENTNIVHSGANPNWPGTLNISRSFQCCEDKVQNGIVNPNDRTVTRQTIELWSFESRGMGNKGNGHHTMYLEMRPDSHLNINNIRVMGSNGSSSIKTTMADVQIRHSLLNVSRAYNEPDIGLPAGGDLTHTPVDVTAVSDAVIYGNHFRLWQQPTVGTANGLYGNLTAGIHFRLRQAMHGSDKPFYPSISWDPPSPTVGGTPPGGNWSGSAATFVNDAFWRDVTAKPITDPLNVFSFKHFVSFNRFELLAGSPRSVAVLRDDGTHPMRVPYQFATTNIAERTHPLWVERSMNFLHGNEYVGYGQGAVLFQLDKSQYSTTAEPGSKWPRDADEEFPHLLELSELPLWFKL